MVERSLSREASDGVTSGKFGLARCLKVSMMSQSLLQGGHVRADETTGLYHAVSRISPLEKIKVLKVSLA